MRHDASRILRFHAYEPLLAFANEPLTRQNWETRLKDLDEWQLFNIGIDAENDSTALPRIDGSVPNLDRALKLRNCLREELERLASLSSNQSELGAEDETTKMTWRRALVLPSGERFFEDAGHLLNFLAEALEYEIRNRKEAKALVGLSYQVGTRRFLRRGRRSGRQWSAPQLHLQTCKCGCGTFFLWEGDWNRKERKFVNDEHRMKFHNGRNVERKRILARERRGQGNPKYH